MAGIFHEYYTVALAPAVGALVGIGASMAWSRRELLAARMLMAAVVAGSSVWAAVLLGRSADWNPWLAPLVLVAGGVASVGLMATCGVDGPPLRRRSGLAAASLAAVAVLAGPVAYSVQTAMTPHSGSIVTAGPDRELVAWVVPVAVVPVAVACPSPADVRALQRPGSTPPRR